MHTAFLRIAGFALQNTGVGKKKKKKPLASFRDKKREERTE